MNKYNLTLGDWNLNISNIYKKVDMYVNNRADHAVECVAFAVRELCDMRHSDDTMITMFYNGIFHVATMIDMLCTKCTDCL